MRMPLRARAALSVALTVLSAPLVGAVGAGPAEAATSLPCQTSGAWRQGELNVYWFDVEQGDSQLVVGPTGKTLLVDLGEDVYNSKGATTNASMVAAQIRNICGTGTTPVALD